MIEREKQKRDTRKKKPEEVRHTKGDTGKPERARAGSATSRDSAQDKEYVEHIEEKTEKH